MVERNLSDDAGETMVKEVERNSPSSAEETMPSMSRQNLDSHRKRAGRKNRASMSIPNLPIIIQDEINNGGINRQSDQEYMDIDLLRNSDNVRVIHGLQNTSVVETNAATFKCTLSDHLTTLRWFIHHPGTPGEEEIKMGKKYNVFRNGGEHQMTIFDVRPRDEGIVYLKQLSSDEVINKAHLLVIRCGFEKYMKPQSVKEGQSATFTCTVKPRECPVIWYVGHRKVDQSTRDEFDIKCTGSKRVLTINSCSLTDAGDITVKLGPLESTAELKVKATTKRLTTSPLAEPVARCHKLFTQFVDYYDEKSMHKRKNGQSMSHASRPSEDSLSTISEQ